MLKIKDKNKKGQIGTTLTWFITFLIIFFVIILFISSTLILSSRKKINIELIEHNSASLESQRSLIDILRTQVVFEGNSITTQHFLINWSLSGDKDAKKTIEKTIKEKLDLLSEDGKYIFYAAYSEKNKEIKDGFYGRGLEIFDAEDYITLDKNIQLFGEAGNAKAALERADVLYLLSDKNIKIKLYIDKAK